MSTASGAVRGVRRSSRGTLCSSPRSAVIRSVSKVLGPDLRVATMAGDPQTGLGVWIPLPEEAATVQFLLERGWGVAAGERYRFRTPPGIRVTTTDLDPRAANEFAAAIAAARAPGGETYAG